MSNGLSATAGADVRCGSGQKGPPGGGTKPPLAAATVSEPLSPPPGLHLLLHCSSLAALSFSPHWLPWSRSLLAFLPTPMSVLLLCSSVSCAILPPRFSPSLANIILV